MDSQQIEILGRHILIDQLLQADLEVATPLRDRGVDLLCYREIDEQAGSFRALPIQLKAASRQVFGIYRKYARINDLLIAFVWNVADPANREVYALTHAESLTVGETMGWTLTASWERGLYTTTRPGRRLSGLLEPFRMDATAWRRRIDGGGAWTDTACGAGAADL